MAAKVLANAGAELLGRPELIEIAKKELSARTVDQGQVFRSPLAPDAVPPTG